MRQSRARRAPLQLGPVTRPSPSRWTAALPKTESLTLVRLDLENPVQAFATSVATVLAKGVVTSDGLVGYVLRFGEISVRQNRVRLLQPRYLRTRLSCCM